MRFHLTNSNSDSSFWEIIFCQGRLIMVQPLLTRWHLLKDMNETTLGNSLKPCWLHLRNIRCGSVNCIRLKPVKKITFRRKQNVLSSLIQSVTLLSAWGQVDLLEFTPSPPWLLISITRLQFFLVRYAINNLHYIFFCFEKLSTRIVFQL